MCICVCVCVLLSSGPPSLSVSDEAPPTSGSSRPATTDHTCVPSAAHTHNLTLIVSNLSALLRLDNKRLSRTVTTDHMKHECVCLCVCVCVCVCVWTGHYVLYSSVRHFCMLGHLGDL